MPGEKNAVILLSVSCSCCTKLPVISGNLVYDSFGLFDKASESKVKIVLSEASSTSILSPEFCRLKPAEPVSVITIAPPKLPVGVPPPKMTRNPLAGIIVLSGIVCRVIA